MAANRTFLYVVGTRPNFMKIAPILAAMRERAPADRHVLIHTGQHYDDGMSRVFIEQLGLPEPDHHLGVGSGPAAQQTARIMLRLEPLLAAGADILVVPGDVTSTLAAALAGAQRGVPVAHVEAGLRSRDRTMPEELNRTLTDRLSALLFTHSPEAVTNLAAEGIPPERVHDVGNTMIDTLVRLQDHVDPEPLLTALGIERPYLLVTLHRPALVDGDLLEPAMHGLAAVAETLDVVFPVHPRTRRAIRRRGIECPGVRLLDPLGYLEFLALQSAARAVLTDSGGVQEETTFLGVPCFTLRANTERPVTLEHGTNVLLGLDPERIRAIPQLLDARPARSRVPAGWDGRAAERIADVMLSWA